MRKLVALLGAIAALGVSTSFAAYPERPVKLIVPWAARRLRRRRAARHVGKAGN